VPTYVTLYRYTDQGIKNIKEAPRRVEAARQRIEQAGGRLLSYYWLQGAYDFVATAEFSDDESATAFNLAIAAAGNVRSETMRAYGPDDLNRIIAKLP